MGVLITGSSGFLGKIFMKTLVEKGVDVLSLSDLVETQKRINISEPFNLNIMKPVEMVVHAAGKAHFLPRTLQEEADFFKVNLQGTKNLCDALFHSGLIPNLFIFISSVAIYGKDSGLMINENETPTAYTPYARSKLKAEEYLTEWADINKIRLFIFRLPLVAGRNPPGNLGAMINGIKNR